MAATQPTGGDGQPADGSAGTSFPTFQDGRGIHRLTFPIPEAFKGQDEESWQDFSDRMTGYLNLIDRRFGFILRDLTTHPKLQIDDDNMVA